jgi:hypothetical protein
MTKIVDVDNSIVENADSIFSELQSVEQPVEAATVEEKETPEEIVPEKFRGKDLKDIVHSYEELERSFGKQGQELGELRKITDEFIKRQVFGGPDNEDTRQRHANDETELDIQDDSVKAVDRLIEKKLGPVLEELRESKKEKMTTKLKELHPDFIDIVSDSEFVEWVKKSPIRTELYIQADKGYDPEAANELFTVWKERKGIKPNTSTKKVDEETLRKATMETGTASEDKGEKKYRRADIINLMKTNPTRYQQLEGEIRRAYTEGRVV